MNKISMEGYNPLSVDKKTSNKSPGKDGTSFVDLLSKSIKDVKQLQKEADIAVSNFAIGKSDNIHDVMIAKEKADVAFRLLIQTRNKILSAYQEVMRMQV